ncbi:hypothetical protein MNBD_CHLOROFLEXI01-1648, partial [hydrothermal vent metagenome]
RNPPNRKEREGRKGEKVKNLCDFCGKLWDLSVNQEKNE